MIIINDHNHIDPERFIFIGEDDDEELEFQVVAEFAKGEAGIEINIEDNLGMSSTVLIAAIADYMIQKL